MDQKAKLFYKDEPVFGLDIGRSSLKVMQIETTGKAPTVIGYGNTTFDQKAISKGVIVDPEVIVKAAYGLISENIIGKITTKHVGISLPNEYSFSRILTLPKMERKELEAAVIGDAEQSIPMPLNELYYDYEITNQLPDGSLEVQLTAAPRNIVDSYMTVAQALGLTVSFIETNIPAVTRIVTRAEDVGVVTLIIDLGSTAADLSIFDGKTIRITGTADCGSDDLTNLIAKHLGVSQQQAHTIKTRYGLELSKKQKDIVNAVEGELGKLISEVKKVVRYYSERAENSEIGQIIVLGGGANLPGLSTYLTDKTRVPTRLCDPWQHLSFGSLQPPHQLETTIYTTAGGLSLLKVEELTS